MALDPQTRAMLEWELSLGAIGIPATAERVRPTDPPTFRTASPPTPTPPRSESRPPANTAGKLHLTQLRSAEASDALDKNPIDLQALALEVQSCARCDLHRYRTHTVFSRGTGKNGVAFVGEGPGLHEDQQGLPFVGPSGELLDKMIAAMHLAVADVYICNVVKCRPPENRAPLPNETAACSSYLEAQLRAIAPRVVVALGRSAAEALCQLDAKQSWRGIWAEWNGIPVMPTYHPAYLLRDASQKRVVWEDLKKVMARLEAV